jgi:hypothetical protein
MQMSTTPLEVTCLRSASIVLIFDRMETSVGGARFQCVQHVLQIGIRSTQVAVQDEAVAFGCSNETGSEVFGGILHPLHLGRWDFFIEPTIQNFS